MLCNGDQLNAVFINTDMISESSDGLDPDFVVCMQLRFYTLYQVPKYLVNFDLTKEIGHPLNFSNVANMTRLRFWMSPKILIFT